MVRLKAVLCRNCRISKIQIGYKFIIHAKHIFHIVFKCASEMSYSRAIDCDRRLSPLTSFSALTYMIPIVQFIVSFQL
jgi:hypothetical protein